MERRMSQLRRISFAIGIVAAIAGAYALGRHHSQEQASRKPNRRILYYVDPMHPAYKSEKPGVAPDCGMALEPVYADEAQNTPTPAAQTQLSKGTINIDVATQRLLGIRVAMVEKGNATRTIHAVGRVVPEDKLVYRLDSGVDGFIRETFDDSVGVRVKKDQKLATYYSPDFLSVASGFLAAEQLPGAATGHDATRTIPYPGAVSKQGFSSLQGYSDRLRALGMSDVQIREIAESKQLPTSIEIISPADGFILAKNITPGMHFEHSMELYRVADLRRVWVVAEVPEEEVSYLHAGGTAQVVPNENGRRLTGHITDSLPQSEAGGGTVKLRVEVENPQFVLRPEMVCGVELPVRLPPGITVPLDALVDSGEHTRVYVQRAEGVFEPRQVEAGWRSGERVEIRKGVKPGERVVSSATFLVDSESRLRENAADGVAPGTGQTTVTAGHNAADTAKDPSCGMKVSRSKAEAAGNTLSLRGVTYYFCSSRCKEKFQSGVASASMNHQPGS